MPERGAPKVRKVSPTVPEDAVIGRVLGGRYRVTALIGRGGMAPVYRAADEQLPREVAVKLMFPGTADPEELGRQRNEIDTLASLNHPALVTLLDAGVEQTPAGDRAFIVMELVDGPNLREAVAENLTQEQVAHIGADIAETLHYMHARGIVHRDIKPANILLAPSGVPHRRFHAKLTDLGIAKLLDGNSLTSTGLVVGTADYLSPEQASGATAGAASDIYSLGLVLLETLTGEKAFPGTTAETLGARLVTQPTVPDSLGTAWTTLLMRMTALDPEERADALEVALAARSIADAKADDPAEAMLDRTLVYPVSLTATTEVIGRPAVTEPPIDVGPARESTAVPPGSKKDSPIRAASRRGARNRLIGVTVAVAVVAGVGAGVAGMLMATAEPPTSTPSYPPVEGVLGEHLQQLQDSVAP
ncbi:serine/threonine protein kinase [Cryobacterium mesophilum]|uniref:Serine/threonine protein kinase n=1 Tax=Terrimesophilobacter mesophilus TaxID=433647 RepID=A0A4R8VCF1_9MICO|nr:serine/threonine-protein kinase [Terrimesophilobacter mesophilus]MBB5632704.1 serine/threonine protein kinase [Terrimesophilobacter mesophilus]TFB79507.1 serine/threonine protein kinase [Terrimesophilobacter mesophilus]